jgi:hypothetical protein
LATPRVLVFHCFSGRRQLGGSKSMGLGLLVAMTSPNPANVDGTLLSALLPSPRLPDRFRALACKAHVFGGCPVAQAVFQILQAGLPTYGSSAFPTLGCLTQYMKALGAWSAPWPCMPCNGVTPPSSSFPEFTLLLTPLLRQATKLLAGSAIS